MITPALAVHAVIRTSSDGVAGLCTSAVLWFTSCLHTMARNMRREMAFTKSDSTWNSTKPTAESDTYRPTIALFGLRLCRLCDMLGLQSNVMSHSVDYIAVGYCINFRPHRQNCAQFSMRPSAIDVTRTVCLCVSKSLSFLSAGHDRTSA